MLFGKTSSVYPASVSDTFYAYKSVAILFVVMAHLSYGVAAVSDISSLLATIGVPVFLFTSGFFFNREQDLKVFCKKKFKNVVVPWLVYGLITYTVSCICDKTAFNALSLLKWVTGNGTYLYFVPILLLCFLMFRLCNGKIFNTVIFLLFILSNVLCVLGKLKHLDVITEYQMLFNWCGFFQLGMLSRKNINTVTKAVRLLPVKIVTVCLWLAVSVFYYRTGNFGYWTSLSLIYEFLSIVAVFIIADSFLNKSKLLIDIGKNTYVIYFLHAQFGIASVRFIFNKLGILGNERLMLIIQPVCVVLVVYAGIKILKFISNKLKLNKIMWIFGILADFQDFPTNFSGVLTNSKPFSTINCAKYRRIFRLAVVRNELFNSKRNSGTLGSLGKNGQRPMHRRPC